MQEPVAYGDVDSVTAKFEALTSGLQDLATRDLLLPWVKDCLGCVFTLLASSKRSVVQCGADLLPTVLPLTHVELQLVKVGCAFALYLPVPALLHSHVLDNCKYTCNSTALSHAIARQAYTAYCLVVMAGLLLLAVWLVLVMLTELTGYACLATAVLLGMKST